MTDEDRASHDSDRAHSAQCRYHRAEVDHPKPDHTVLDKLGPALAYIVQKWLGPII